MMNWMKDVSRTQSTPCDHYDVVIIEGGAAGITVAAELLKHRSTLSVAIVEPSESHAYQPGWTLVGAGVAAKSMICCATVEATPSISDAAISVAVVGASAAKTSAPASSRNCRTMADRRSTRSPSGTSRNIQTA